MAKDVLPTSIRFDADVKIALAAAAEADGRSVSSLTDRILRAWLIERGHLAKPEAAKAPAKPRAGKPTTKPRKKPERGR